MIVVADASPLHYLVLIDHAHILEKLYGNVIIPQAVFDELSAANTPPKVKTWVSKRPSWLEVRQLAGPADPALSYLGVGEHESILLAQELLADALIIDDKKGRTEATERNLLVIGTLGVLVSSAERSQLDLPEALRSCAKRISMLRLSYSKPSSTASKPDEFLRPSSREKVQIEIVN
jgi:predicted nucleic acid-binding protein